MCIGQHEDFRKVPIRAFQSLAKVWSDH
jgi:hypothetical protein